MRLLILDVETTPSVCYTWGLWNVTLGINMVKEPGTTLCYAAKWYGEKEVMFSWDIRDIWSLLDEADAVIHFNGKSFDVPTIQRDFLLAGLLPPSPYKQIDLRQVCKSQFRFLSGKLDSNMVSPNSASLNSGNA